VETLLTTRTSIQMGLSKVAPAGVVIRGGEKKMHVCEISGNYTLVNEQCWHGRI
jgi:hypothetical protein